MTLVKILSFLICLSCWFCVFVFAKEMSRNCLDEDGWWASKRVVRLCRVSASRMEWNGSFCLTLFIVFFFLYVVQLLLNACHSAAATSADTPRLSWLFYTSFSFVCCCLLIVFLFLYLDWIACVRLIALNCCKNQKIYNSLQYRPENSQPHDNPPAFVVPFGWCWWRRRRRDDDYDI